MVRHRRLTSLQILIFDNLQLGVINLEVTLEKPTMKRCDRVTWLLNGLLARSRAPRIYHRFIVAFKRAATVVRRRGLWLLAEFFPKMMKKNGVRIVRAIPSDKSAKTTRYPVFPEGTLVDEQAPFAEKESSSQARFESFPGVAMSVVHNAEVVMNRRFNSVVSSDEILVNPRRYEGEMRLFPGLDSEPNAGIIFQSGNSVLIERRRVELRCLESAVYFGSVSPGNWFHWLIDNLSALYVAIRSEIVPESTPLIVPSVAFEKADWLIALRAVAGNRTLVAASNSEVFRVGTLYWPDSLTDRGPYSRGHAVRPLGLHKEGFRLYQNELKHSLRVDSTSPPWRKLYLARKDLARRTYNQDEALELAKKKGYEAVFLEDMELESSALHFSEATHVIGPHGAGWANIVFCPPGTSLGMWTWPMKTNFAYFSNLAVAAGARMSYFRVEFDPKTMNGNHPDSFRISPESLAHGIARIEELG